MKYSGSVEKNRGNLEADHGCLYGMAATQCSNITFVYCERALYSVERGPVWYVGAVYNIKELSLL